MQMPSSDAASATLASSRWATSSRARAWRSTLTLETHLPAAARTTGAAIHPAAAPATRADTLTRITRLLARVEWKAYMLIVSRGATAANANDAPVASETMFRLDFYEFYALLERLLVLLLHACGIDVRGSSSSTAATATNLSHRFHANVLEALERDGCPLREALGRGEARMWLARAKEFRNRWKDADGDGDGEGGEERAGLDVEGLGRMLEAVLEGVRAARAVVEALVVVDVRGGSDDGVVGVGHGAAAGGLRLSEDEDLDMDDVPWEAVDDAMDWDWDGS